MTETRRDAKCLRGPGWVTRLAGLCGFLGECVCGSVLAKLKLQYGTLAT